MKKEKKRARGYPYLVNDAHFNAIGTRITAEALADRIISDDLLSGTGGGK